MGSEPEERALVVTQNEAQEMNARVRDLLFEHSDVPLPHEHQSEVPTPFLQNPRPLALQIICALRDLQSMAERTILVSEEECWFLERRVRYNDREPAARTLLKKVHALLLEFHPELAPTFPEEEEEDDAGDQTYKNAVKGADPDSDPDASKDTPAEPGAGD